MGALSRLWAKPGGTRMVLVAPDPGPTAAWHVGEPCAAGPAVAWGRQHRHERHRPLLGGHLDVSAHASPPLAIFGRNTGNSAARVSGRVVPLRRCRTDVGYPGLRSPVGQCDAARELEAAIGSMGLISEVVASAQADIDAA